MTKGRIIIGSNWGDEGKGTVVAHYTKNANGFEYPYQWRSSTWSYCR